MAAARKPSGSLKSSERASMGVSRRRAGNHHAGLCGMPGSLQKYARLPSASLSVSTPQSMLTPPITVVRLAWRRHNRPRRTTIASSVWLDCPIASTWPCRARSRSAPRADPLGALLRSLDLRHYHVERRTRRRHSAFGIKIMSSVAGFDDIQPRRGTCSAFETVDADHHVFDPNGCHGDPDDVLRACSLVVGCHGILDVEKDDVGRGLPGLLEQGRVGPGHRQVLSGAGATWRVRCW